MTCKRNICKNADINQRIFAFTAMLYKQSQSNNANYKCSDFYSRVLSERCHIGKTIYQSKERQHDKDNSPDINRYFLRYYQTVHWISFDRSLQGILPPWLPPKK